MNRDDVIRWMQEVGAKENNPTPQTYEGFVDIFQHFAALVAAAEREACVSIIEDYKIPVGNSRAGELACDWTYDALKEIRDSIRARGQEVPR